MIVVQSNHRATLRWGILEMADSGGFFGGIRGIASVTFFRKFKLSHTRQGDTEFSVDSMH